MTAQIPETSEQLREYIHEQLGNKKSVSGGKIISIILGGVEQSINFYCIKETDELIYYDEETHRYSDTGSKCILGFCEAVVRNAEAVPHVQTTPMNEVENHVRRNSYVPLAEFEREPFYYIPLANGIYDLQTNTLLPYGAEYRFLKSLAVNYNPEAKCPAFEKFLDDVCVDSELNPDSMMRKAIIQLFAYCLWRAYPIQNVFFLIGGGANGKGVLLGTLQAFLGNDNVANRSILALSDNRFAGADLYRKHANISNELTVEEVKNVDLLKSLVSGTDYIAAERKHEQPFSFMNYAKIIIATNAPPKTDDATDGFYRRLNLIRFTRQFFGTDDHKDLPEKLRQPEELSGILNLALNELREWVNDGKFNPNSAFSNFMPVDDMRTLYERLADSISAFRYDALEITGEEEDCIAKDLLFKAYRDYCRGRKVGAHTEAKFWRDFRAQTLGTISDKRVGALKTRSLVGLVLKDGSSVVNQQEVAGYTGNFPSAPIIEPKTIGISKQSEKISVYLATKCIKPVPAWIGQDGQKYGPFVPEQVVSLPQIEAEWAIGASLVELVQDSSKPTPKQETLLE